MSLAEPRKKQRIVADPQNKKWADDKGGFGFKMLQKMGWKEGTGLGLAGDGSTEHIKVTANKDSIGLGADKKTLAEDVSGHLQSYEELLRQMNADSEKQNRKKDKKSSKEKLAKKSKSKTNSEDSEKKSKKTKDKEKKKDHKSKSEDSSVTKSAPANRLAHRKKFRSNKDVSGYTPAQLKEIFGV